MQDLTKAINNHLSCEFQASHTYLAMSIWLRERDLAGFSSYMQRKSQEERGHADRLIGYLVDCDEQVELPSVDAPQRSWTSTQTLFDQVYQMLFSPQVTRLFLLYVMNITYRYIKRSICSQQCSCY